MKIFKLRAAALIIALMVVASACTNPETISYEDIEQASLDLWIEKYRPDLLDSQQESGFYVDVLNEGEEDGMLISDLTGWVKYNYTASDLYGNIGMTRSAVIAYQQGTYTPYTHYVPYMAYTSPDYTTTTEWTYLAMCTVLNVHGEEYQMRTGTLIRVYVPSSLVSSSAASGGYEGQYELEELRPMIFEMEVTGIDEDPEATGLAEVEEFCATNTYDGAWTDVSELVAEYEEYDEEDALEGIYIRTVLRAESYRHISYINDYYCEVPGSPYNQSLSELDDEIATILAERFDSEIDSAGQMVGVGAEDDAVMWYIARSLDGFVIDSNIDEVRELIFGEKDPGYTGLYYNADTDRDSYVEALYFSVPFMYRGNWNSMVTTSTYAYGSSGTSAGISSDSSYYDYYSDYYTYYYYYYSSYDDFYESVIGEYDSSSDTTAVATEILPYAPLIFDIFIEMVDEDEDEDEDEDTDE